jgi:protocatechuate 3,4-dioxygenase beta subunit
MMNRLWYLALLIPTFFAFASPSHMRIAPPNEPGERMMLTGRVFGADGKPRGGVTMFAFHTDARGEYGRDAAGVARLHGTLVTAPDGSFSIDTIRPGGYPDGKSAAHMHFVLRANGTEQSDAIFFEGDPNLTPQQPASIRVTLRRGADRVWRGTHDFHLKEKK